MSPFMVLGVSIVPLKVRVAWPASQSQLTALPSILAGAAGPGLAAAVQEAVALSPAPAMVQTVLTALPTTSPVIFQAPTASSAKAAPENESAAKATAKRPVFMLDIPLIGMIFSGVA